MRNTILIALSILCLAITFIAEQHFKNEAIRVTTRATEADSIRIHQTVARLKDSLEREARFRQINQRIDSVNARVDTVVVYLVRQSDKRERRRQRWEDILKTAKNIFLP